MASTLQLFNTNMQTVFPLLFEERHVKFTLPVDTSTQYLGSSSYVKVDISRSTVFGGGFASKAEVFINGNLVVKKFWTNFSDSNKLEGTFPVPKSYLKPNEENELRVEVETGLNVNVVNWNVKVDFTYSVFNKTTNQEEAPPEPPQRGDEGGSNAGLPNPFEGLGQYLVPIAVGGVAVIGVIVGLKMAFSK